VTVIDAFGGPGGWDIAARTLGVEPLGIELDQAACATRAAAGLRTEQADVAARDPRTFAPVEGLIASPPCQAFSMAGQGAGRRALGAYEETILGVWERGVWAIDIEWLDEQCGDPRAHLVLEPLRWAIELKPMWVCLEQVEPVLPLWQAMARVLRLSGYSAWTGIMRAEMYGVPQTRRRAILIARRDGVEARRPPPTHQRYLPPEKRWEDEPTGSLFAAPRGRRVHPEDHALLPWVSMAEALGWDSSEAVGFPRLNDLDDGGEYRERDLRDASEPAFALTEKSRSWARFRSNDQANATVRDLDEPAPTITGGHDHNERVWVVDTGNTRSGTRPQGRKRPADEPAPTVTSRADQLEWTRGEPPTAYNSRDQKDGRTGTINRRRGVDEPAPTIAGESRNDSWVHDRPATTVNCDPRISEPGHHDSEQSGSQQANAIRVTVQEASVLQSFDRDYPWQGTRTKRFEQIGNACPPLLAAAILREVIS
jgi:DNA (cytosine-5)-methyltransferase 1